MEPVNDNVQECALKIDAVWSEADDNLLIKEEIISDVEPDCPPAPPPPPSSPPPPPLPLPAPPLPSEESSATSAEFQTSTVVENERNFSSFRDNQSLPSWQPLKKKVKSRNQRSEENEIIINQKLSCVHDPKNFKIIKRRLRCGDCRSLVCPECCKVMIPNLQSHFLGSGVCSSGTFLCKLCSIIFHSLCALQAHIRIHTMDTPYVCPDCGLIYNNIYFLILHLLNKCYHVYKIVRYKCKQCPGTCFTPESFVQHIQEKHIHCVFRCLYCSSLFNNYDEFNYHMESFHHKQKVQYLNYFRCSLCSNMVIPRFMYQRHVAQHRENSEFYEVDYQCICGETYSLIGAFRSHFTYCDKKGVLPPKWSFLQRKLRTQDLIHHESFQNKELLIQTLPMVSNDGEQKKMNLVRAESKNVANEDANCGKREVFITNNCDAPSQTNSSEIDNELCKKESEKAEDVSGSFSSNASKNVTLASDVTGDDGGQGEMPGREGLETEVVILNEQPRTHSEKETTRNECADGNRSTEEGQNCKSGKESEQSDGAMSKIYDHIPCDHLGYLIKTQCPEQVKKLSSSEDVIIEGSFSPQNYRTVTELDEKTGIMTTKTVPLDELEIEEDEDDLEEIINEDDCEMESLHVSAAATLFCNDKTKYKMSSTISCPFCIVLFPRQNLTFQQFRLHLESYHPDAALNITVSSEENMATEGNVDDCGDAKGSVESSQKKLSNLEEEREFSSKDSQSEVCQGKENPEAESEGGGGEEQEASSRNESEKVLRTISSGEKLTTEGEDGNGQSWKSEDCKVETVNAHVNENSNSGCDLEKEMKKDENDKEEVEEKIIEDFIDRLEDIVEKYEEAGNVEESPAKRNRSESLDKVSPKSISDLEYEGETSKDSNWSGLSGKDTKPNSPVGEKERSRRESEVWSEFYESLMIAEKLKKKKNPSPESEEKKKSVVSDYSSKRVVKKPKRYRESSESVDSNEYSDSEEDFLLEGDLMDKICSEEKGEAENQLNKKQVLLDKLESVDGKFVDYLFDLVKRKEKFFELYKKHSTLRENRYGLDLRSYRKKVLNGIKQRGRPMKILRYHDLLKKKELSEEKNNKEKKTELSPEIKTSEKKRGRPRKYHDPAKLKERRRSDKEVDFIEKNFEREENDSSPSKRKRKLSSKLQYYKKLSDEKDDFSSGLVISNKPADSSKRFSCAVCKEVFPEMAKFREHIVAHRMEENTYQCMECGECFVVRPSLEKHLHAFHKIKNTEKYITDNQCCNIKKETPEAEEEPLKENQCKVCKDQFDRAIDLTKHFRIHGMAFLKEFKKEGRQAEKRNV